MRMKFFLIPLLLFVSSYISAQELRILEASEYNRLKSLNQLPEKFMLKKTEDSQPVLIPRIQPSSNTVQSNATCNCLVPLDTTFSVVPFQNASAPNYRTDDNSSPLISLPFSFCLFGQTVDSVYINNNGNISFSAPYFNYNAIGFPSTYYIMIAPFWADVDTRNDTSGVVYYKLTSSALIVHWDHVGYFDRQVDKLNTFQLIITDGTDPLIPGGNNTAFCYGDMQWTSGSATGGINGFGVPATVGANFGDGLNFIQFGRFDQPGHGYDGSFGANDSVDWLDSSGFVFNLCPLNVPPVALDCNSDTVFLHVGDTAGIDFSFIAAEIGQNVNLTVNAGGLLNLATISNTPGNLARFVGQLVADIANLGNNSFSITATDDGTPAQSTTVNRVFHIDGPTGMVQSNLSLSIAFSPNPFTDQTVLSVSGTSGKFVSLSITDVTGREVLRADHISSSYAIEKGNLKKGIYFYRVSDENSLNEKGKLVIQ
jgi:hypothetical protein